MSEPIISVSGLRGIIGTSLNPEIAIRYVAAFAETLPAGAVVVTRDGRESGPMLASAVQAALTAMGRESLDGGVTGTPTTGILVRDQSAAGGIQISASHNPPEYNGLKLFDRMGRVIPAEAGEQVIANYRQHVFPWKSIAELGSCQSLNDTITAHWELIQQVCNVEQIRNRRFRVLLDANHGAGSVLGEYLLRELGCEVTMLGGIPDGKFAHPAEPTAENLRSVLPQVADGGLAIGFCQDPDADRLAVIDESGNYLGEEYTLAVCVDHVLRYRPGAVVTNCSTSRMTQDLAEKYSVPFFRSKVGEANVVDLMLAENAIIGGEGNGGVIEPQVGYVRDSFVGMALLLNAMATRQLPVSKLAKELPRYAMHKSKITLAPDRVASVINKLEEHFSAATSDRLDGLRLDWADKWLLIRASNTEPIVRIVAEAPSEQEARLLCDEAAKTMEA